MSGTVMPRKSAQSNPFKVIPAVHEQVDTTNMIRLERIKYFNTPAGRERRGGAAGNHRLIKFKGQHKCMVCLEHSNVRWSYQSCTGIYFCSAFILHHPNHPDSGAAAGGDLYSTCSDVFHDSRFTLTEA